jgi:hypothetical protein
VASGDIYVQVTATADTSGHPKSVVVLVPRKSIEDYKSKVSGKKSDDNPIVQHLADLLAMNVFTHRASFGNFKVAHLFSLTPPPEIEGRSPEFARSGLKAWSPLSRGSSVSWNIPSCGCTIAWRKTVGTCRGRTSITPGVGS